MRQLDCDMRVIAAGFAALLATGANCQTGTLVASGMGSPLSAYKDAAGRWRPMPDLNDILPKGKQTVSVCRGYLPAADARLDVVPSAVEARSMKNGRLLWRRRADDAKIVDGKILVLYHNRMSMLNSFGRGLSHTRFPAQGLEWDRMSDCGRYAISDRPNRRYTGGFQLMVTAVRGGRKFALPLAIDPGHASLPDHFWWLGGRGFVVCLERVFWFPQVWVCSGRKARCISNVRSEKDDGGYWWARDTRMVGHTIYMLAGSFLPGSTAAYFGRWNGKATQWQRAPDDAIALVEHGEGAPYILCVSKGRWRLVSEGFPATTMSHDKKNRLAAHQGSDGTIASYQYDGDALKRTENTSAGFTSLIWDGSDYLGEA